MDSLPSRYRKASEEAIILYRFYEKKEDMNLAPVFTALFGSIDEASRALMDRRLSPEMPSTILDQKDWFDPHYGKVDYKIEGHYRKMASNLKKTLVFKNGVSPIGLLRSCLDFALNDKNKLDGIFEAIKKKFQVKGGRDLLAIVEGINNFRNTYVAHQEEELKDRKKAEEELKRWINGLHILTKAE